MRTCRAITLALVTLGELNACSSSTTASIEELPVPLVVWKRERGLCGRSLALDAHGEVWAEPGGCEDGSPQLQPRGKTTADNRDALFAAVRALPANAGPDRMACSGNFQTFSIRSADGTVDSRTCWPGGDYDDVAGLQEPYLAAARAFLALP